MDNLEIKFIRSSDEKEFYFGSQHDWVIAEDGIENFGLISNGINFTDNAISDGGIVDSTHISKIDRTINAIYRHTNNMDIARSKILSFFNVKDVFKVCVTYGTKEVFADGVIYKLQCDARNLKNGYLTLAITFMFASPFWKSIDNFGRNIAALIPMTAFPYLSNPKNGGTTGGIFNFAQSVKILNDGDVNTECQVVINCAGGEVMNPKIIVNDEYVRVLDTMVDGDEIVMDFAAFPPTVKKNGQNFIGHCDRTSAFDSMFLSRGVNVVRYDADNGSSHMNVTIYYYKQYGAI